MWRKFLSRWFNIVITDIPEGCELPMCLFACGKILPTYSNAPTIWYWKLEISRTYKTTSYPDYREPITGCFINCIGSGFYKKIEFYQYLLKMED